MSWMSTSAHPCRDPAGYKKETGKTIKVEKIPKISTGKVDPHIFNTTLIKRNAPAILTACLAAALESSSKG